MLQVPLAVTPALVAAQVAGPVVVLRGQVAFTPVGVAEEEEVEVVEVEVVEVGVGVAEVGVGVVEVGVVVEVVVAVGVVEVVVAVGVELT